MILSITRTNGILGGINMLTREQILREINADCKEVEDVGNSVDEKIDKLTEGLNTINESFNKAMDEIHNKYFETIQQAQTTNMVDDAINNNDDMSEE